MQVYGRVSNAGGPYHREVSSSAGPKLGATGGPFRCGLLGAGVYSAHRRPGAVRWLGSEAGAGASALWGGGGEGAVPGGEGVGGGSVGVGEGLVGG